jgi:hypothetical protein
MIHKKATLSVLFLLGFCHAGLHAQEAIIASGGEATGNGVSVTYSVGQIVYTSNTGLNGSVAQGVQQPFEISVESGIDEFKDISLQCLAYPNPAADYLILKIDNGMQYQFTASLYDIKGKLFSNTIIESNETRIDMRNLSPAVYFLKIVLTKRVASPSQIQSQSQSLQSAGEIKTFKIIKN